MKAKTLSVLAGVSAPLILTGAASAGFVGISVVLKEGGLTHGLAVWNVYAVFDRPDDEMFAVFGTPSNPLSIRAFGFGGGYYQDPQGQPLTAPYTEFLPGDSGILQYDTFVTIGVKSDGFFDAADDVQTTAGLTFENDVIETSNGGWFIIPSGPGQGGIGAPDANGQVLLFQGSINPSVVEYIEGDMLLTFTSNGVSGQQAYVGFTTFPAPGVLPLLGLAGLTGARRRR